MSSPMKLVCVLFFASSLFLQGTLGEIECEELPSDICSFSVASSRKRCLLESFEGENGKVEYQCRTSKVMARTKTGEYIETDECVSACGVDRNALGITPDSLLEAQSLSKLCSPACYESCNNIIDLYFNIAAGEGVFLYDLCEMQRTNPRRAVAELLSFGATVVAPAPAPATTIKGSLTIKVAPAPASI